MIDFSAPKILKPRSSTHAVTPEPQELMVGRVVSTPFDKKMAANSLSDFMHPYSSTKMLNGKFTLPDI